MFNFTTEEKQAIIFILVITLLGSICGFVVKKNGDVKKFVYSPNIYSKFNLNKASKAVLITLPYVGEKLAQKIIDYRQVYGNFSSLEELKNIKGLTAKRLERISNFIIFE